MQNKKYISNTYIQEKLARIRYIGERINDKAIDENTDNLNEVDCLNDKKQLLFYFAAIAKEFGETIPDNV